ncbi:MAG: ATP-binding cassette domain-containing protein [Phototrophicales bacterium]
MQLKNIHKRFGQVHANNDISVTFQPGRIIGILGENGAGKSTLMKIIAGYQPADSGEIWLDGRPVNYHDPRDAIAHGIGMLQQDPLDIGAFSVLENFVYGQSGGILLNRKTSRQQLIALCQQFNFELDPDTPVSQLSIAQRQQLEIIRLLGLGVKVLILDEPTTGISAAQKEQLFNTLKRLAKEQNMTILLVSHKLEDVLALCDEVIVLRAGQLVGDMQMPTTKAALVELMFGAQIQPVKRESRLQSDAPIVLQMQQVHLHDGRLDIPQINFSLRAGEVIGLAGLDGSGQALFMRACAGLIKPHAGRVFVKGQDLTGQSYHQFNRSGVIFAASGRLEEGLIADMTLTEHIALMYEQNTWINWRRAHQFTQRQIERFNVRGKPDDPIQALSGGNQQRVLMGLLPENATALILEQPTRGLDVDSARWIWDQLLTKNSAIIYSSADLDEIMTYSDRIIVFYAGRMKVIDDPHQVTVSDLGHYIGGDFS